MAGEGEGSIVISSAKDHGESLASFAVRNLLIEDDLVGRFNNCKAGVV